MANKNSLVISIPLREAPQFEKHLTTVLKGFEGSLDPSVLMEELNRESDLVGNWLALAGLSRQGKKKEEIAQDLENVFRDYPNEARDLLRDYVQATQAVHPGINARTEGDRRIIALDLTSFRGLGPFVKGYVEILAEQVDGQALGEQGSQRARRR